MDCLKEFLPRLSLSLLASLLLVAISGVAQSQEQKRGDGSLRLEFQAIKTGTFKSDGADFDYWSTDSRVAIVSGDYALNDRWTLFAALPYVRKRFNSEVPWGGDPHNPNDPYWVDFVPPDTSFLDDGSYHGDFQYFSDWHFDGNFAYVFSEEPLGVNVDYWLAHLSAGYWFKANLSVNAFFGLKYTRKGISLLDPRFINENAGFPPVYPDDWDTEEWWHHDRMVGNRNLNFGFSADYFFSPEWKVSGSAYQSVWTEESTEIDYAFTIALTRFFGGD